MRAATGAYAAVAWAALALTLPASAQTVYRCGPDGRSYTQQPCDDGKAVRVDDDRSDAQRRAAEAAAGRDARVAHKLERERLAMKPAASAAIGIDGRGDSASEPAKMVATKKRRKSLPDDAGFRAAVPRPAKTKPARSNG